MCYLSFQDSTEVVIPQTDATVNDQEKGRPRWAAPSQEVRVRQRTAQAIDRAVARAIALPCRSSQLLPLLTPTQKQDHRLSPRLARRAARHGRAALDRRLKPARFSIRLERLAAR